MTGLIVVPSFIVLLAPNVIATKGIIETLTEGVSKISSFVEGTSTFTRKSVAKGVKEVKNKTLQSIIGMDEIVFPDDHRLKLEFDLEDPKNSDNLREESQTKDEPSKEKKSRDTMEHNSSRTNQSTLNENGKSSGNDNLKNEESKDGGNRAKENSDPEHVSVTGETTTMKVGKIQNELYTVVQFYRCL